MYWHITYPGSLSNPSQNYRVVSYEDYLTWYNGDMKGLPLSPVSEHKTYEEAEKACKRLNASVEA